jgi:VanZ family protein
MPSTSKPSVVRIALTVPVLVLVLAATAIPIELRPFGEAPMTFEFGDVPDIIENIVGYVPVGIVLGRLGLLRAILIAGLISAGVETSQMVMAHRDPSVTDMLANLAGAVLGALASARWNIRSPALRIGRWAAGVAILLALAVVLDVWSTAGNPVSPRGATSPGRLEASWNLDERDGRAAADASGNAMVGRFHTEPARIAGARGRAPAFDGANYVDVRNPTAFRLEGSMTISAWIDSRAYPVDDAAIVSQLGTEQGYQLDTTIDEGPRTIGFKLSDACGELMAR